MEKLRLDLINDPDGAAPEGEEYDLSFYEDIEAPKYVDFTVPDLSRPDDGSWFCVRIGCDQNHEEVDPDALYGKFVLRVMSARSPNVRLRRKLDRKAPSLIPKCPHTAPAKEAKSRFERLSTMTSFPDKMAKTKLKDHPISTLRSTPRQVKAKYLCPTTEKAFTTPRKKKCSGHQFRSVKYQKAPAGTSKSKNVAKVLFKDTKKETSETSTPVKSRIPVSEVCTEMKKPKITSHKKIVPSRYLSTPATPKSSKMAEVSKENIKKTGESTMSLKFPKASSKKSGKVESTENSSNQAIVSADVQQILLAPATTSKSLQSTLAGPGTSSSSGMVQNREENRDNDLFIEKIQPGSTIPTMSQTTTNVTESLHSTLAGSETSSILRTVQNSEEDSENVPPLVGPCSIPDVSNIAANSSELDEYKENSVDMVGKREIKSNTRNFANEILQNALPKACKPQNKSCNVAGNQWGMNKRTTNPKPFRFRTDERGILKERNIEKKLHVLAHKVTDPPHKHGERLKQAGTIAHNEDEKVVLQEGMLDALQDQASVHAVVPGRPTKIKLTVHSPNSHKMANGKHKIADSVNKLQGVAPLSTNCRKGTISCVKKNKNEVSITAVSSKGKRPVTLPREPHFHRIHQPKDCSKREGEVI